MAITLPDSIKPFVNLLFHIAGAALMLAGIVLIEVLLAGFLRVLAVVPFAPEWLKRAAEWLEQGLFLFDVFITALFLLAEAIKFVRGLYREIANG